LTLQFSDGNPAQVINVLAVVPRTSDSSGPAGYSAGLGPAPARYSPAVAGCVPAQLIPTLTSIGTNFSAPVALPSLISVQLVDDCGSAVPNAAVLASFSNGDTAVVLNSLNNGSYVGTWQPLSPASRVNITVTATLLTPIAGTAPAGINHPADSVSSVVGGVSQVQGSVLANPNVPQIFPGGIVNTATFSKAQPLAPSTIAAAFGQILAPVASSSALPLPTALGGITLTIGGIDAPLLFASGGQVNAQIPAELAPNSRQQAILKFDNGTGHGPAISLPETITISSASPGIFTTNQQGTGQGAILNTQGQLVDSGAPTTAGNVVQVFATGLGITQPAVPSGQPAPSAEPLARVTVQVQAQVGGLPATVQFAGLAPGFVALYQVNVQIPDGVTPGPNVPLVLFQNGVPSNPATLAIR
jgi:uncharacterized protein (TIGR03437 family)